MPLSIRRFRRVRHTRSETLFVCVLGLLAGSALAAPQGGQVVAGQASINQQGNTTRIDQSSQRAVIDWRTYSVGAGERVQYVQPNAQSATLNRVTGQQASVLQGRIDANGQVILINPNGVTLGKGAQVNVGSLIASTAGTSNARFMQGELRFDQAGKPGATIHNQGAITAVQGGLVALVAPHVRNDGVIEARAGRVKVHQRETVTLDLNGDALVNIAVPESQAAALRGAPAGSPVALSVTQARSLVDAAVNLDGANRAQSVFVRNGRVMLIAAGRNLTTTAAANASLNQTGYGNSTSATPSGINRRGGLGAQMPTTSSVVSNVVAQPGAEVLGTKAGASPTTTLLLVTDGKARVSPPPSQPKPHSPSTTPAASVPTPLPEIVPAPAAPATTTTTATTTAPATTTTSATTTTTVANPAPAQSPATPASSNVAGATTGGSGGSPGGRTTVRTSGGGDTRTAATSPTNAATNVVTSGGNVADVRAEPQAGAGDGGNWAAPSAAPAVARVTAAPTATNAAVSGDARIAALSSSAGVPSNSPSAAMAPALATSSGKHGRRTGGGTVASTPTAAPSSPALTAAPAPTLVASFSGGRGAAQAADLGRTPVATVSPSPEVETNLVVERPILTRSARNHGSRR